MTTVVTGATGFLGIALVIGAGALAYPDGPFNLVPEGFIGRERFAGANCSMCPKCVVVHGRMEGADKSSFVALVSIPPSLR